VQQSEYYEKALLAADAVPCNDQEVQECLERALTEGDERAIYARAQCYRYGSFGTEKDLFKAHTLTKCLEKSNIAEAVFNLAFDYDTGNYVRKNVKRAFALYMVAGLLGDVGACLQVSRFYAHGEVVPQNKVLAKAWRQRSKCAEREISPLYRQWLR
jgi:uncharacterized protein